MTKIYNLSAGATEIHKNISQTTSGVKLKIIIGIIFIIVVITLILFFSMPAIKKFVKKKKAEFPDKRCSDPLIMTFPGMFGPPGTTYAQNKAHCDAITINETHKKNINPIQEQISKQQAAMVGIVKHIQDTKKMIFHIRQGVENEARDVYQKLHNTYSRLAYVFKVFARLFYRVFMVFKDVFDVLKYAFWTMSSLWNGPLGGTLRFFCFGEETLLFIERGGKQFIVKMSELAINDVVKRDDNSDIILGMCKFENRGDMYNLLDVYVSGSHSVLYNGKMIRAEKHPLAKKVEYDQQFIYCPITNSGKIKISENIFGDYQGDNTLKTFEKVVNPILKNRIFKNNNFFGKEMDFYKTRALNLYPGFTKNSFIRTQRGVIKAEDLEIGDEITGKKIVGIINYNLEGKTFVHQYRRKEQFGIMVGIQIFHDNNDYKVINQDERQILGKLECIGIIIEDSIIKIEDIEIAHFEIVNDELREIVEESLCPW